MWNKIFCSDLYLAVDKVEALKHYKFSLAFENSNEEDYVTEKYFQSLVAGMKILLLTTSPSLCLLFTLSIDSFENIVAKP